MEYVQTGFVEQFRLDAWFTGGMFTRIKDIVRKAGSVAASAVVAASAHSSPTVEVPTNPSASTLPLRLDAELEQAKAILRVNELSRSIDEQLASLGKRDMQSIEPSRLQRARQALAVVAGSKS